MKILYLSYFAAPELFSQLCEAKLDMSVARQNYDICMLNNLLSGELIDPDDLEIVSYLPYNQAVHQKPEKGTYRGKEISYIWTRRENPVTILQAMHQVKKKIQEWLKKTEGEKRVLLTYATNPVLLAPTLHLHNQVPLVTICSEVPKYRNMTEGTKSINSIKKKAFSFFNDRMDGYIYMSKYMDEVCNPHNRPWTVVEGMTEVPPLLDGQREDDGKEVIMYAGGLHVENGIDRLLDAVVLVNEKRKDNPVILQLCGEGNASELARRYAERYEYIQCLGFLPNDKVRRMERAATLLINPRKPDSLLTRYSFASKTFEYFSSGTAAMSTRLAGIPDAFYEHCYECDCSTAEKLAEDVTYALSIPLEERRKKAMGAYNFLITEKAPKAQTEKIVEFLNTLVES